MSEAKTKNTKNNEELENTVPDLGEDYDYGFSDDVQPIYSTGRGLTEATVREISAEKDEPEWMLNYRLRAYRTYQKMPMPDFGPDLSDLDLDHMLYYQKATDRQYRDWED